MNDDFFTAPSLEHLAALLPGYEFEAFIAQGGMGAVYMARQRSLDREVAIKILPREFGEDAEFRASFETEAKAMAKLNHPNLIGVYDFGNVEGMPYIVMEFVNGKSLFHSAYELAVDPVQAVTIVKGICDGLAHAHENGIIHRDIKPANILLTPRAEPKIGDFGLARPAGHDSSGLVMGTPGYTAPEVLSEPEQADRRSDLFSLGVVLYELLTGRRPPYDGNPPPPSTISRCDVSLDRICEKATHPIAALRYQHAAEMSAALDAWLHRANRGGHDIHAHAPPRHSLGHPPRVVARRESRSGGFAVAAVILAAGLGFLGWKWLGGKPSSSGHDAPQALAADHAPPADAGKEKPAPPADPRSVGGDPPRELPQAGDSETVPDPATADGDGQGQPETAGNETPEIAPSPGTDTPESTSPAGDPPTDVADLDSKAKALLKSLVADTDKDCAANAKNLIWAIDSWLKSLPRSEQQVWTDSVSKLKNEMNGNRVPTSLDDSNLVLSEKMSALCLESARKQSALDDVYRTKADRIRSSYVSRMLDIAGKLKSGGDGNGAAHAEARAGAAGELGPWLVAMGFPAYEPAPVGDFTVGDAIVGHWRSITSGAREFVFMKNGTCRSPDDRGTWKRDGDARNGYLVQWGSGKWTDRMAIGENKNRLAGANQNNQRITLVRQDAVPLGQTKEGAEEISGWWKWLGMDNNIVEIRKDGTAFSYSTGAAAEWVAKGNRGSRVFSITWLEGQYKGFVNVVKVTDNGKRLADTGEGAKLNAVRGADVPQ